KKAIQYAIQDGCDDLMQFLKEFNKRKEDQQIQAELIKQQELLNIWKITTNGNQIICNTNGILLDSMQVLDLIKHKPKGRPSSKRLKSSIEQPKSNSKSKSNVSNISNNDRCRKCGLCGE
ncbi:14381_t:CDS:1, partial [Racocetra fulgida]